MGRDSKHSQRYHFKSFKQNVDFFSWNAWNLLFFLMSLVVERILLQEILRMARCFLHPGVKTTVVGHEQEEAYCRYSSVKFKTRKSKNSYPYDFGSDVQK